MARISYVDPATLVDPELRASYEALEQRRRHGGPGPETHLIRAHVPAVAKAVTHSGRLFQGGVLEHAVKELCHGYLAETLKCGY